MEQIIKYVAFDGKEFDDEDDCFNYEWLPKATEMMNEHFTLYDKCKEKIETIHFNDIDGVFFVNIKTLEGLQFFHKWSDDYGVESPFCRGDYEDESKLGIWGWEPLGWGGGWCHLTKMKNSIDELIEELK